MAHHCALPFSSLVWLRILCPQAYRMTKRHADDPMAKMMDSDTLLDG